MITPTNAADMRIQLGMRPLSHGFTATSKAIRGLELTPAEEAVFLEMSGGVKPRPGVGFSDVEWIKPRRGGGSEMLATEGVYECAFVAHAEFAAPGQILGFPIICPQRGQANEVHSYARGIAAQPGIAHLVEKITADEIVFTTGTALQIATADINSVSSKTFIGYGLSEFSKFPGDDAAQSDRVIVSALDPATAPIVGAPVRRRLRETSPFIQEGLAYEIDQQCFGKEDAPTLVLRCAFSHINPNIDQAWLDRERRKLPYSVACREYGKDFRSPPEWQQAATESWWQNAHVKCADEGRGINEPNPQFSYFGGLDLGVRQDGAALAIGHRERLDGEPVTIVDGVFFWPAGTATMKEIVTEAARIIRKYRARCWADQFHFDSIKDDFAREQVVITEAPWTSLGEKSKSARFARVKFEMRSGNVRLPGADHALSLEFANMGGRLLRSGVEQLAARRGGDDRVHAVVLMVSEALEHAPDRKPSFASWSITEYLQKEREFFQNQRRLPARFYHPIFDRNGQHLDYRTAMKMAKDGTL